MRDPPRPCVSAEKSQILPSRLWRRATVACSPRPPVIGWRQYVSSIRCSRVGPKYPTRLAEITYLSLATDAPRRLVGTRDNRHCCPLHASRFVRDRGTASRAALPVGPLRSLAARAHRFSTTARKMTRGPRREMRRYETSRPTLPRRVAPARADLVPHVPADPRRRPISQTRRRR